MQTIAQLTPNVWNKKCTGCFYIRYQSSTGFDTFERKLLIVKKTWIFVTDKSLSYHLFKLYRKRSSQNINVSLNILWPTIHVGKNKMKWGKKFNLDL